MQESANRFQPHAKTALQVESLEERQMLSTVSVFAQGTTGEETIRVTTEDGSFIRRIDLTTEMTEYQFDPQVFSLIDPGEVVDANNLRIEFINDVFDPSSGVDRNAIIDKVRIGDKVYETENAAVFSTGTWTAADGVQDGFGRGETLHSNGYLQYSNNGLDAEIEITSIEIDAEATGDVVQFELQVDGQTVENFFLNPGQPGGGRSSGIFRYDLNGDISPERIRVAFTNDKVFQNQFGNTVDRNLKVNSVSIDGEIYRGVDSDVFSTGTWTSADGIQPGFGRGDTLHGNGYFEFAERDDQQSTLITVDTTAVSSPGRTVDTVYFDLQIDGVTVQEYAISVQRTGNADKIVTFDAPPGVTADRVRIVHRLDIFSDNFDRNLRVNSIQIGDQVIDPATDPNVFSTATWRAEDGIVAGFGRGNILHGNGYFQFG